MVVRWCAQWGSVWVMIPNPHHLSQDPGGFRVVFALPRMEDGDLNLSSLTATQFMVWGWDLKQVYYSTCKVSLNGGGYPEEFWEMMGKYTRSRKNYALVSKHFLTHSIYIYNVNCMYM